MVTNIWTWMLENEDMKKTLIAQEEYNSNVNGGGEKVLPLQNPKFWYVIFKPSIPNHLWLRWHEATYDDGTLGRRKLANNFVFTFFFPHLCFLSSFPIYLLQPFITPIINTWLVISTLGYSNNKNFISNWHPWAHQTNDW